jgi:hypothetical protein
MISPIECSLHAKHRPKAFTIGPVDKMIEVEGSPPQMMQIALAICSSILMLRC